MKSVIIYFCLFASGLVSEQHIHVKNKDSFSLNASSSINLVKKIETEIDSALYYSDRDFKVAYKWALSANKKAVKFHNSILAARSYAIIASIYQLKELPIDSATYFYHKALEVLEEKTDNESKAAFMLYLTHSTGRSGIQSNDENLKILLHALSILNHSKLHWLKADVYDRIGHAYWQKGFETEAPVYYHKSIDYWLLAMNLYNSIGYFESGLAEKGKIATSYLSLHQPDKAIAILEANLLQNKKRKNRMRTASTLMNLADYYFEINQLKKAESNYKSAANIYEALGYRSGYGWVYKQLITLYEVMDEYQWAFHFAKKRIQLLAENIENEKHKEVYKIRNDYEKKRYLQELKQLKAENQIKVLQAEQNKIQKLILFTILSSLLLILFFYSLYYKKKQKNKELRIMLESQEQERSRMAIELHDGLGGLLSSLKVNIENLKSDYSELSENNRKIINTSISFIDDVFDEIRSISHNLAPPLLKHFGLKYALPNLVHQLNLAHQTKFAFDCIINNERLKPELELHMYRLILESVQNILKHAQAKNAFIRLIEQNEYYSLMIEDDGIGFDLNKKHQGMGLKNLKTRVDILRGKLTIDTLVGNGTTIVIKIPK